MLAAAFQVLHFRQYLDKCGDIPETLSDQIALFQEDPSPDTLSSLEALDSFQAFMKSYVKYTDITLAGEHGSTAQFWMQYIQAVHVYLRFDRACRTNDLDLFVYTLGEMRSSFFAANRPNYARWMVRYHPNLPNIDKTYQGVKQILSSGGLTIRRTGKNFSRAAV